MSQEIKQYKVFIASPSDLEAERETARQVCEKINQGAFARDRRLALRSVGWEDLPPAAGRPQEGINPLVMESDIVICMLHRRYGTPTGQYGSGTEEEFLNAYERWKRWKSPKILFYFKPLQNISYRDFHDPQIQKVMALQERIQTQQLLMCGTITSAEAFSGQLYRDLEFVLLELAEQISAGSACEGLEGACLIPGAYINWLNDRTAYMDVEDLTQDSDVITVGLPEIFLPLYGDDPDEKGKEMERGPEPEEIEAIAGKGETLLVTGVAGCGKTTLAKHMARSVLNNELSHFPEDILPVLLYFKDLRRYEIPVPAMPNAQVAEELLAWYCRKITGNMLTPETIRAFCEAGRCLFILDGLDEADHLFRDYATASFADLRCRYPGVKMVLLGRPHGVGGETGNRFGGRAVTVHDLTGGQAETFITKWFTHVYNRAGFIGPELAQKMITEIRAREDIKAMMANPLMLTAMCILYNDAKVLPDQRADLYNRFVERLLSKFGSRERTPVRRFLMYMAHTMFTAGERGMDQREAVRILEQYLDPMATGESPAQAFLRIEPATGLLTRESGQYKFIHLTFQEFLTARHLHDTHEGDPYDAVSGPAGAPRYREVVSLFIGLLSLNNAGNANACVRKIMEQKISGPKAQNWITAAQSLLDIQENTRDPKVVGLAWDRLLTVIRAKAAPKVLLAAGVAMGRLGYRKGYKDFVKIQGGVYDLEKIGKEEIPGFEISRYPVTNFWFREFMEAGGYKNPDYWTEQGQEWLRENRVAEPLSFRERRINCPTSPVVGVSWYEAKAFCNWLTRTGEDGFAYDFPTEAQWQAAAAGKDKRTYPWGEELHSSRCNYRDAGLRQPSPVGIFMTGKTREGIHDLAGNVWEWTRTACHQKKDLDDFVYDPEFDEMLKQNELQELINALNDKNRIIPALRGGAFLSYAEDCRCPARGSFDPDGRDYYIGFRCARIKR